MTNIEGFLQIVLNNDLSHASIYIHFENANWRACRTQGKMKGANFHECYKLDCTRVAYNVFAILCVFQ